MIFLETVFRNSRSLLLSMSGEGKVDKQTSNGMSVSADQILDTNKRVIEGLRMKIAELGVIERRESELAPQASAPAKLFKEAGA